MNIIIMNIVIITVIIFIIIICDIYDGLKQYFRKQKIESLLIKCMHVSQLNKDRWKRALTHDVSLSEKDALKQVYIALITRQTF